MPDTRTATEAMQERMSSEQDERSVHAYMRRFIERWAAEMDRKESAEFQADLTLVLQAVHRDASRETHSLLRRALSSVPTSQVFIQKK